MKFGKIIIHKIELLWLLVLATGLFLPHHAFGAADLKDVALELNKPWSGDFEQMVQKRVIRVLIPYSKTFYFLDMATQRGLVYEMVKQFGKEVNSQLEIRHLRIQVIFIPTSRDKLIPNLAEGLGDIAAGNLTITGRRKQWVDFCDPFLTDINEILVTGPKSPPVKDFFDLSGKKIHVRKSSSYYESLGEANKRLTAAGKAGIKVVEANENLEDEDLIEMLNAGLISMMIIDSHKGELWTKVFEDITLHPDIRFRENSNIAWAIQKNTPGLKKKINAFVKLHKKGTLMGNIFFNRYLKSTKYIKNNLADSERKRFKQTIKFFKKYADKYNFDWLMLAALAYQESAIDQSKRSQSGAIGVMQVLPGTAKDKNINIPNIEELEGNIHAGTKYLRFMMDRYFSDPVIDKLNRVLLTFASYNAGPAKISSLQKEAITMNLDPNVWFKNVEVVAAGRIGRETVQYVNNIFKYYIAYASIITQESTTGKSKKLIGE